MAQQRKPPAKRAPRKTRDKRDAQALELWRGGASFDLIATQLGFKDPEAAETAAIRELERSPDPAPEDLVRLELHRLDVMQMSLWTKARRGDEAAIDRVMSIQKQRQHLRAISLIRSDLSLAEAVTMSVEASDVLDMQKDAALIVALKKIANQIDIATKPGADPELGHKSMYLVPHMSNLLKEMRATPAARQAVAGAVKEGANGSRLLDFQEEARKIREGKREEAVS